MFISLDRPGLPDIDSDIMEYIDMSAFGIRSGRDQVYDYVVNKYGSEYTSKIITFGTLAAKVALKDVARTLEIDHKEVTAVNKFIPSDAGKQWTLTECIEGKGTDAPIKEIQEFAKKYPVLYRTAMSLESMPRHTSVHAAGVLITPKPVRDIIALAMAKGEDEDNKEVVCQWDMRLAEEIGLTKFDFLGLRTLGVLKRARDLVKDRHNIVIDLNYIPDTDEKALQIIKDGRTLGIFQLESTGMTSMFTSLKNVRFDDIVAGLSLYRPGPMAFIPKYIAVANGKEQAEYLFPELEPILKETHGVIVYQESVMRIATDLAGFSKADSDGYRKAIGKKIKSLIIKYNDWLINGHHDNKKEIHIDGMVARGFDKSKCEQLTSQLEDFGKYSFDEKDCVIY